MNETTATLRRSVRTAIAAFFTAAAAGAGMQAMAAERYPERPITMVVPMGAGGTADVIARLLAPKLSSMLGQPVIIENRAGANGVIGEEYFSRVKPDGYTIMLESSSVATNPWMSARRYDARKAFIPVVQLASVPLVLVVNSNVQATSAAEFAALARERPGSFSYASWGNGSIGHFAGEMFKIGTKSDMQHVPYKTTGQALTDTLSGQVQAMLPTLPLAMQQMASGKIRPLAVTSAVRSPLAPNIPTMQEAGVSGVEIETWFGIFLPDGAPAELVTKLNKDFVAILHEPAARATLEGQGFRIVGSQPAEFARFYQAEIARYGLVARQVGMKEGD